jgi:hypothetical protein
LKKLAIILIGAGVVIVFAISGFQARNIFAPSVTEEAKVTIKVGEKCVAEASDGVPREIHNCQNNQGDTLLITHKPRLSNIEQHEPVQSK